MFTYEMHQARRAELQQAADHWRLVQQAKAAHAAERRARRSETVTGARTASRTSARADAEGAASARAHRAPRPLDRIGHAVRPHRANQRTAA